MEIESQKQDKFCIVRVKGRMDAVTAPDFETKCASLMEQGESTFIVDFGGLEYISSAGLRALLVVAKKLKSSSGAISFCSLTPAVERVFSISGFGSMFSLHDSLQNALAT
jgi:stage II sporulation protein AA (anti-sigma F factor antagonist)